MSICSSWDLVAVAALAPDRLIDPAAAGELDRALEAYRAELVARFGTAWPGPLLDRLPMGSWAGLFEPIRAAVAAERSILLTEEKGG